MTHHRDSPAHAAASHHGPADPAHVRDDTAWHALADGRLAPADAAVLRAQLQGDTAALETIAQWQEQRQQLQSLHADMLDAPVPDMLLAAALRAADRKTQQMQWWRWGGMAASVCMAFVLGWAGHGRWSGAVSGLALAPRSADNAHILAAAPAQRFAHQAAVAHAVYQPEVRHPVEVGAAQQDHLVQWLSKRLGRPLHVPLLSALGYELVGGRLLPGDTGARAQFMYQNGTGQRITLYLGAVTGAPAPSPALASTTAPAAGGRDAGYGGNGGARPQPSEPTPATAFQFTDEGPVPGFYWVDAGFGYALSGQLSRAQLLALATAIYPQMQR